MNVFRKLRGSTKNSQRFMTNEGTKDKGHIRVNWESVRTGLENQRKGHAAAKFAREEVQFQGSLLNQVFPIRDTSVLLTSRTREPQ